MRRSNPLGGIIFLAVLVAIALINWVSDDHFFAVAAVAVVAFVATDVAFKVRRTRRRSEANHVALRATLDDGQVRIRATKPGRSQSRLNGRLQGVKDAKEAKAVREAMNHEPSIVFSVKAGTDQRWIIGYREGVAEILPDATVDVAYQAQRGSSIV